MPRCELTYHVRHVMADIGKPIRETERPAPVRLPVPEREPAPQQPTRPPQPAKT